MLFRKPKITEEYELVQNNAYDNDLERLHWNENWDDGINGEDSSGRTTKSMDSVSEIFNEIESEAGKGNEDASSYQPPSFDKFLSDTGGHKPYRKWIALLLFICIIIAWIAGVSFYAYKTPISASTTSERIIIDNSTFALNPFSMTNNNLTMKGFQDGSYLPYRLNVKWLSEPQRPRNDKKGGYYMTNEGTKHIVKKVESEWKEDILKKEIVYLDTFYKVDDIILNPTKSIDDEDNMHIVVTDRTSHWRHLSFALYWLYRSSRQDYILIQPEISLITSNAEITSKKMEKIQFARFSSNGESVIFGSSNDIYILFLDSLGVIRVTEDGSQNIFNGKPDWVYEEEVVSDDKLFWFSPNLENLIYLKINDTEVEEYTLQYYVKESKDVSLVEDKKVTSNINQYPYQEKLKYPKPGTSIPKASVFRFHVPSRRTDAIDVHEIAGDSFIVYDAFWVDDENFMMKMSDRTSTILSKILYLPNDKDKNLLKISDKDTGEYNGWVQKKNTRAINTKTSSYIDKTVRFDHTQLALYDHPSDAEPKILTNFSNFDIVDSSPLAWDTEKNLLYFLTTKRSPMDAHLVALDLDNESNKYTYITDIGKDGLFDIDFSNDCKFLNLFYKGPQQPWQKIISMKDLSTNIKQSETQKVSQNLAEIDIDDAVNGYATTQKNFREINFPTTVYKQAKVGHYPNGHPILVNFAETYPPNFDPSVTNKHPLLVHVYGGPDSQLVNKAYRCGFEELVSSALGAIVLSIDPRGTNGQGWDFKSFARHKIGYWEPRDVVAITTEYIKTHKFLNKDKVSIWGWSYGGFTVLKCLEYDQGRTFNFGIAVAPVTNWLFYDSIYSERYLGLPSNNSYGEYASINRIEDLMLVKRLLLIHGTADDNVHLQNLFWLVDKLNIAGLDNFDMYIFPDSAHLIKFHNAHNVIFERVYSWLKKMWCDRDAEDSVDI